MTHSRKQSYFGIAKILLCLCLLTFQFIECTAVYQTGTSAPPLAQNYQIAYIDPADVDPTDTLATGTSDIQITSAGQSSSSFQQSNSDIDEGYIINFTNVGITEYLRFISKISEKNFIFDENDLQFNVTIVSEQPSSIESIITTLVHTLRINGLSLIEQENNFLIHRNADVPSPPILSSGNSFTHTPRDAEIITRIFELKYVPTSDMLKIIKPMLSTQATLEELESNKTIIISDLETTVTKIAELIRRLDTPSPDLEIGQYSVESTSLSSLLSLAQKIIVPLAQDETMLIYGHAPSNSIFIVSTPYLTKKALNTLKLLDTTGTKTRVFSTKITESDTVSGYISGEESAIPPPTTSFSPLPSEETTTTATETTTTATSDTEDKPPEPQPFSVFSTINAHKSPSEQKTLYPLSPESSFLATPEISEYQQTKTSGIKSPFTSTSKFTAQSPAATTAQEPSILSLDKVASSAQGLISPILPGNSALDSKLQELRWSDDPDTQNIETDFEIIKLQYRKAAEIQTALSDLAQRILSTGSRKTNEKDLNFAATIDSIQAIPSSNSVVITGTAEATKRVRTMILRLDAPSRQVFIEMLIIDTSVDNSLSFGVEWGTRTSAEGFASAAGRHGAGSPVPGSINAVTLVNSLIDASTLANPAGFNVGAIGKTLTHNGEGFATIGALVKALHTDAKTNILMNPKIIAEDNIKAEIFVGANTRFKGDSISNDDGTVITTNYEYRDVGTRFTVTPTLGSTDIITLDIEQEVSSAAGNIEEASEEALDIGPVTRVSTTSTRVHVPDRHFLIISGMMQDETTKSNTRVPCLGGLPLLGSLFSSQSSTTTKRNLMIFIRPQLVDTSEDINELTHRQEEIWIDRNNKRCASGTEMDEGLEFLKLKCDEW